MNCLKCGAKTTAQNVFCDACQQDMARHPIPKDAVAVLPDQERRVRTPRTAYVQPNAEQQLLTLRKHIRRQRIWIWILSIICLIFLAAGTFFAISYRKDYPIIGQNYNSTVASSASASNPPALP